MRINGYLEVKLGFGQLYGQVSIDVDSYTLEGAGVDFASVPSYKGDLIGIGKIRLAGLVDPDLDCGALLAYSARV